MTEHELGNERLPAIGHPPQEPQAPDINDEPDFAEEHEETAVDEDIISGEDEEREEESPKGWAGMQQ
jgi:hypothetical protein